MAADVADFFGHRDPKIEGKCRTLGAAVEVKAEKEWDKISDSLLGDVIESGAGLAKWAIKKVLTLGLTGPSVDLKKTGLWGGKAQLAGMLVWLGLLIAVAGVMWQLAKMALTGQVKHLGRAAAGWGENLLLSTIGVSLFALLLTLGDAFTDGLVEATFRDKDDAYARIVAVMVPTGVINPVAMAGIVGIILIIGVIQMIMVFLRLSAIPIICLLLPVAGGGRTGGDTTRKWAPNLITAGMVIVAYKPMLAIIVCTGFSSFGHAETLTEWLRGCATLTLAILAPGPLTKIFAPFGAAVGGGLAAGGAGAAFGAAVEFLGRKKQPADGGEGAAPASAVEHADYVSRSMGGGGGGKSNPSDGDGDATDGPGQGGGPGGSPGQGAQGRLTPPEAPKVPTQAGAPSTAPEAVGAGTSTGTSTPAAGGLAEALKLGIVVMDGVNDSIQKASDAVGGGNGQ
ncbi:hypothetical protein AB0D45_24110 [Streptomyces sp. NPDC048352]|uniref:hypothetical protein n=1 Tax=Streptomyces sp. NPDC048352 TaxID=3154718 RepID=UPI003423BDD5